MIMVIKMRLSILELGVPMPWPATFTVIPLLFVLLYLLHLFLHISLYYSPFISFPHISALPLGLDVHISLSAFIYLEIWWSRVTRYGGWHTLPICYYNLHDAMAEYKFHYIYI